MVRTKVAFLYSEVAGYFMACADKLSKFADVLIIHWPVNDEAPFKFEVNEHIQRIQKSDYSQHELKKIVADFAPDILVCSGWMDKQYIDIVRGVDKHVVRVLSLDNHWKGNIKQQLARVVSRLYLKRIFSHAWVPGTAQAEFAQKLGFGRRTIRGYYCADTDLFDQKYKETIEDKIKQFPKRFLYVARYVKHKGIFEMWQAFQELQAENPNEWELWCLGTGEEWDNRVEHDKIRHIGFVQPKEMDDYIRKTSVYILPSIFEPWGVSVQEFAIAGFPLILSDAIGSKENFLKDNGFQFEAGNVASLKAAMKKIISLQDAQLKEMVTKSHHIGMAYTTDMWVKRLLTIKD